MNHDWWRFTTIYHIYPRSFQDSDGDGIGDLQGIINRLDYLQDLGIETIWISPFFSSPGQDYGYDVSDYYSIDPIMGNMEITGKLVRETHKRDMKIVLDLVMNHTSNQHEWFRESRSSLTNPKRDWYIWKPGQKSGGRKAPNNWRSMIGKKGWNYDPATDEWYYSSFLSFQPDLNWINPDVQKAMFDMVRFWLDMGIDGFRLDIFNCLGKNQEFTDNPFYPRYLPTPDNNDQCFWQDKQHNINHPYSYVFARALRKVIDEFPERFIIGEVSGNEKVLRKFLGEKHDGLNLVFQFQLLHFQFKSKFFYNFLTKMESEFPDPYVPVLVYSNHDIGRGISRIDNDFDKGKILALFQLTARGIPVLYYGDEIGMGNHDLPLKMAKDPLAKIYSGVPKKLAKFAGVLINRDDARTPLVWDRQEGCGFSDPKIKPWLPIIKGFKGFDVASQQHNPDSLWNTYASLLKLRKCNFVMERGKISNISHRGEILYYEKYWENENIVVIINFSRKELSYLINKKNIQIMYNTKSDVRLRNENEILLPSFSGAILTVNL